MNTHKNIPAIYKITNIVNNKYYIGSTCCIHSRWDVHIRLLRKNKHHSIKLQRAWDKYGEENFSFEIIRICNENELMQCEQWFLDILKPHYNMLLLANCGKPSREPRGGRRVSQYTLDGQFVKVWDSMLKASKSFGFDRSAVLKAVKGETYSIGGFRWAYEGEELKPLNKPKSRGWLNSNSTRKTKAISQLDVNRNHIANFNSIKIASELTGVKRNNISMVLSGDGRTAGGFIWEYLNIEDKKK